LKQGTIHITESTKKSNTGVTFSVVDLSFNLKCEIENTSQLRNENRISANAAIIPLQDSGISPQSGISHRPLSFQGSIWTRSRQDLAIVELDTMGNSPQTTPIENSEVQNSSYEFTKNEKRRLVYFVSLAAMFSPLSSNIYFPAMNSIARVWVLRVVDP
jgi:hypothetical protein